MLTFLLAIPAALQRAVRHLVFFGDPIDPVDRALWQLIADQIRDDANRSAAQLDADAIRRHDNTEGTDR